MCKTKSRDRSSVRSDKGPSGYFKISFPHVFPAEQVVQTLAEERLKLGDQLSDAEDFKWEYLLDSLLSKLAQPGVNPSQRADAAIEKMLTTETVCRDLNVNGFPNVGFSLKAERFNTVIMRARSIIFNMIGEFDCSVFERSAFSSGASTSRRRAQGDPYFKYNSRTKYIDVTRSAYPYAVALIKSTPFWGEYGATLRVVLGNEIFTVPKKTEIDRCCAKEPDMNLALQRSVGLSIRDSLKTVGIDLRSQTRNQRLAKEGSITGQLATIDLSSASDSISIALVRELMPASWFAVMDDLRSHLGTLPNGSVLEWEKFSSMGNGFTFELESLIFYALTRATLDYEQRRGSLQTSTISVYGDDIICPSHISSSVIAILSDVGFKTNAEKTFVTGPFRESCGEHYYNGKNVSPFYIRKPLDTIQRAIWLANKIRVWSYDHDMEICDPTLYPFWKYVRSLIPKCLRGGRNIETEFTLYSPGKSKMRLSPQKVSKSFRGGGAYLRFMQSSSSINSAPFGPYTWMGRSFTSVLHLVHGSISADNPGKIDASGNTRVSPTFFKFKKNGEPWAPRQYLFSQEIDC